ncbi:hypothetical protein [Marmoricola sp. Leaf446]|uniref:hypothetical protein n=1 Tax=Marmoricola sp. Leaf446 TaxID=1736379 RepID=UPI0009E758B0|nr:hypothetical protein [Marmoricola sp. Leaf446]
MSTPDPVAALLARVPEGWSEASYAGRRWSVTRTTRTGGRSASVWAEALDGSAVVSTNAYALGDGWVLKPCEMPLAVVVDFLEGVETGPGPR